MTPSTESQFEAGIFALTAEGWTIVKRRTFTGQFPAVQWVKRNSATLARKNSPHPIRGSVVELGTWLTLEWVLADYEQKRKAANPEFNEPEAKVFMVGGKINASYTTRQGEYLPSSMATRSSTANRRRKPTCSGISRSARPLSTT